MSLKKTLGILAGIWLSAALSAGGSTVWAAEQKAADSSLQESGSAVVSDESADLEEVSQQVESALASAGSSVRLSSANGTLVVALDPGHDAGHTGASAHGVREEVATLKIAQYCKAELETYGGVSVYMTRTTAACPYPETVGITGGNLKDIDKRVQAAKAHGADAFVSIHLNSSDNTDANGSEVYYHALSGQGKSLAEKILARLAALGLRSRGVKNDPAFRVTIDCYNEKIPGIIVEHAFLTNVSDVKNHLSTEQQLKQLGIADATGIANYFKLSKSKHWANYDEEKNQWICFTNGKADYTYTGMVESSDGWLYVKNGISDFTYTGLAANGSLLTYVTNGKPDTSYTGLVSYQQEWLYVKNGSVQNGVTDLVRTTLNGNTGWWYVKDGKVSFTNALVKNSYGWWYVKNGMVDFNHYGIEKNENGWWRIEKGKVNFGFRGFAQNQNGWWYLTGGKVQFGTNGLMEGAVDGKQGTWDVAGGKVQFVNDIVKSGNTWWYIHDGMVDRTHDGVEKNRNGWWRIEAGKVNFGYQGFAENSNGWWYLTGGKVQFGTNGLIRGTVDGKQGTWDVAGGKVQFVNDIVQSGNIWWYIHDGMVDRTYSGVEKNRNGWWRIEAGKVNFGYQGFAENSNGWWYLTGGKVHFNVTDVIKGDVGGVNAWWYVKNGKVQFTDTLAKNQNGWWRIEDGKVNFAFNGIAKNEYGWWYLRNGKVDFSYNGTVTENDVTYQVAKGKVDYTASAPTLAAAPGEALTEEVTGEEQSEVSGMTEDPGTEQDFNEEPEFSEQTPADPADAIEETDTVKSGAGEITAEDLPGSDDSEAEEGEKKAE